jgi:hypothetical protein
MSFYVYQYLTEDGIPYYIGKGSGNRMNVKHSTVALPIKERRMIIQSGLTNNEAKQLEAELITKYKRKVDGGILDNIKINQWACAVGWKHSEETKQKISKSNLGKVRTTEQRRNYTGPKTKEHAEKIRQANLNRLDDGRYLKISATKSKQRWFTNGKTTVMVEPGQEPIGFVPGRKLYG